MDVVPLILEEQTHLTVNDAAYLRNLFFMRNKRGIQQGLFET